MTPSTIKAVAHYYSQQLRTIGLMPKRIDPDRSFCSYQKSDLLSHALYLVEGIGEMDPSGQFGKMNRHLAAAQMCLSFADLYTLNELRAHNMP